LAARTSINDRSLEDVGGRPDLGDGPEGDDHSLLVAQNLLLAFATTLHCGEAVGS
jgi:hypothetical protein